MVWTNAVGVAFTATLLSVSDVDATFVFSEDGATNVLQRSALSAESFSRACEISGHVPLPPALVGAYRQFKRDMIRIDALEADERVSREKAAAYRRNLLVAFRNACAEKGFDGETVDKLIDRLYRETN